jgi:hypothetical protein
MAYCRKWAILVETRLTHGGFGKESVSFQWRIRAAVMEPGCLLNVQRRLQRSVLHLSPISGMSHPFSFGRCRMVTGTLRGAPCQICHAHAVVSYWTWALVGGESVPRTKFSIGGTFERTVSSSSGTDREHRQLAPAPVLHARYCPSLLLWMCIF